jgi:hypothetical protein
MPTQKPDDNDSSGALDGHTPSIGAQMWVPSIGAQMWVQAAKDFGSAIRLLPVADQPIAAELVPILWSGDSDEAAAAANTLYELIDDPPMSLIRVL